MSLFEALPKGIHPSQVRVALKSVIEKHLEANDMFDDNGWLTLGFYGYQPEMAERYISTGSLYLCTVIFLVLGLESENLFWSEAPQNWSQKKI
jgi:hypothetical protein